MTGSPKYLFEVIPKPDIFGVKITKFPFMSAINLGSKHK